MKIQLNKLLVLLLIFTPFFLISQSKEKKHNILFISIDDFRPKINSYGESQMITPNIDKLASIQMKHMANREKLLREGVVKLPE